MLIVHSSPKIQQDKQFGWQLTYWLGDAFDYGIPFRKALAEIVTVLGQVRKTDLDIPPFAVGEDFVEGSLHFGPHALRVYYEYSLGYLALGQEDKQVLAEVASALKPVTRQR